MATPYTRLFLLILLIYKWHNACSSISIMWAVRGFDLVVISKLLHIYPFLKLNGIVCKHIEFSLYDRDEEKGRIIETYSQFYKLLIITIINSHLVIYLPQGLTSCEYGCGTPEAPQLDWTLTLSQLVLGEIPLCYLSHLLTMSCSLLTSKLVEYSSAKGIYFSMTMSFLKATTSVKAEKWVFDTVDPADTTTLPLESVYLSI